jgi:F0F1-type ATP synthase assembly protein I
MWSDALRHLAIGWEIVVALALGYVLGWWLDRLLHTSPWLKIVGTALGLAAGVRALMRVVREYRAEVGPDDPDARPLPRLPRRRHRRRRGPEDHQGGNDGA